MERFGLRIRAAGALLVSESGLFHRDDLDRGQGAGPCAADASSCAFAVCPLSRSADSPLPLFPSPARGGCRDGLPADLRHRAGGGSADLNRRWEGASRGGRPPFVAKIISPSRGERK